MYCSISGSIPQHPVVGKNTGLVYEYSLISKAIQENGKCPVSNKDIAMTDLIHVTSGTIATPKPPSASSIPNILSSLQNEWDAITLDSFKVKQELDITRKQLAEALYNYEAACRIIASLTKERDEARYTLETLSSSTITSENQSNANSTSKKRQRDDNEDISIGASASKDAQPVNLTIPETLVKSIKAHDVISKWKLSTLSDKDIMTSIYGSVTSIDAVDDIFYLGRANGSISSYNINSGKIVSTLEAYPAGSTVSTIDVRSHAPDGVLVLSSSNSDKTVKLWRNDSLVSSLTGVASTNIINCLLHPLNEPMAIVCSELDWSLLDLSNGSGQMIIRRQMESSERFSCMDVHPDGILIGTGSDASGELLIWDLASNKSAAVLKGHKASLTNIAFSENGYSCASSSVDGTVKLWDLRNPSDPVYSLSADQEPSIYPTSVSFDSSGVYLAVGTSKGEVRISSQNGNEFSPFISTLSTGEAKSKIKGMRFSEHSKQLGIYSSLGTVSILSI